LIGVSACSLTAISADDENVFEKTLFALVKV